MKEEKTKYSFILIISLITLFYFFNNILGIDNKLILINYIFVFLILMTGGLSIWRAVKEKNKIKGIPGIIILLFVITAFVLNRTVFYPQFYIKILSQIGLAIFFYEMMDFLKIELEFNKKNIIALSICILIITIFLLTQVLSINKYKNSYKKVLKFIYASDLNYKTLTTEFEKIPLDYMPFEEFLNSMNEKIFVTPAYYYRGQYGCVVGGLKEIINSKITDNKTFKKNILIVKDSADSFERTLSYVEEEIGKTLIPPIIITSLEFIMVCFVGLKNGKVKE